MLETFTLQTFTPLVGASFRVQVAPDTITEMSLTEAGSRAPTGNPFSLVFAGPSQPILAAGTYRFEQLTLGNFDVFISPIGQTRTATLYEAVFHRTP